eukprot:jgi/Galph1/3143/GphlegSOOS_G1802.1
MSYSSNQLKLACPDLRSPSTALSLVIIVSLFVFTMVSFIETPLGTVLEAVRSLALFIFRNETVVKLACELAWLAHLLEALYAFRVCLALGGGNNSWKWTLQTFLVGFPSLSLLLAEKKKRLG